MSWGLPCKSRGIINSFIVSFHGVRSGYPDHTETLVVKVDNYESDEVFKIHLSELKPSFNYTYRVAAKSNGSMNPGAVAECW